MKIFIYHTKTLIIRIFVRHEPHIYPHNSLNISNSYEDFLCGGLKSGLKMGERDGAINWKFL